MVRLGRRPSAPNDLSRNKTKWTIRWRRIANREAKGDWATPTAKRLLREALEILTHGKCAFCESQPKATGDIEIEHYIAKTIDLNLAFEWTNLLPSCRKCNRAKRDREPGTAVRPDEHDPELHFWINQNGELEPLSETDTAMSESVRLTVELFDLNRGELCRNRSRMIASVKRWLKRIGQNGGDPPGDLADELKEFIDPKTNYKLALRQILMQATLTELVEIDRQRFERRAG